MGPHSILVQEHRASLREMGSWKALVGSHGWLGVWANAVEESRGRSGGVATLVGKGRPTCMVGEGTNRAVGPALALTRR